jgi:hypothetical protein
MVKMFFIWNAWIRTIEGSEIAGKKKEANPPVSLYI